MTDARIFTVGLAADHAGFELKSRIANFLCDEGHTVLDLGARTVDRVDYPDYGAALALAIADGRAARGIGICGSGIGISIALNRHPQVRAALCHTPDYARLARAHNDANAIALGARMIDTATAVACVEAFLQTEFEGGRHAARVAKLGAC